MHEEVQTFDIQVLERVSGRDVLRAEYGGEIRDFTRKAAAGTGCIVYFCPVATGWVCFLWPDTAAAALAGGEEVTVRAALLTGQQRRELGITVAGGNLTNVLPAVLGS